MRSCVHRTHTAHEGREEKHRMEQTKEVEEQNKYE